MKTTGTINENLKTEADRVMRKLSEVKRVIYSSVGDGGIANGLGQNGTLIDLSIVNGQCMARVLFDGDYEPEWMDARILHIAEKNN